MYIKKTFALFFLAFCFFGLVAKASASSYYVDFTNGLDSNPGTIGSPLKNHPWMYTFTGSVTLQPGDTVYMKRGETWSASTPTTHYITVANSGTAGNYITTTAYGSGNQPLIKIGTNTNFDVIYGAGKSFIVLDSLHIEHYGAVTTPNPIEQDGIQFRKDANGNVPHDWIITNNEIDDIPGDAINGYDDSYNITIGDINATQTATTANYSNNIHDFTYGAVQLLGRNPVTNRSDFNVYYNWIHNGLQTICGNDEYGIAFTARASSSGWPMYAWARYNRVENIPTWEALDTHGGGYLYYQNNYLYNFRAGMMMGMGQVTQLTPVGDHYYVENNTFENPVNQQCMAQGTAFIQLWGDSNNIITNTFIRNNKIFFTTSPAVGTNDGIVMRGADTTEVSGNEIYSPSLGNTSSGINLTYGWLSNIVIKNNYIHGSFLRGINSSANPAFIGPITIANNIIIAAWDIAIRFVDLVGTLNIFNNTLLADGAIIHGPIVFENAGAANGAIFTVKNNVMAYNPTKSDEYFYGTSVTSTGTYSIDSNLYSGGTAASPFDIPGQAAKTWAGWQALGHDLSGQGPNVAPQFNNLSGSDFTLAYNSPAIDTGTITSAMTSSSVDYLGNPIYGTPDIGAYEYQPPHNMAISDAVDIGAGARIYADGKFRDLGTTNSVLAHLKVTPQGGSYLAYGAATTRPGYLDITNITNWTTTHKTWTESNAQTSNMITDHTIGDLSPNLYYSISVTGASPSNISGVNGTACNSAVCQADGAGKLSFEYNGGYSTHTFDMTVIASPTKTITAFNFTSLSPAVIGVINESDKTITLTVPFGTSLTNLVPTIVTTGISMNPNSGVAQNFIAGVPVNYTVTAADTSTQVYAVTVNVASGGYSVNTTASNGLVSKLPDSANYTPGTSVTLVATANSGFTFSSWSGDVSGSVNPLTVTVNADMNITANFIANVVSAGGGSTVTPVSAGGGGGGGETNLTPSPIIPPGGFTATSSASLGMDILYFSYGIDTTSVVIANNPNFISAQYYNATSSISWKSSSPQTLYIKYCNVYTKCSSPLSLKVAGVPTETPPVFQPQNSAVGSSTEATIAGSGSIERATTVYTYTFNRNLSYGMTGTDVLNLQKYLNEHNFVVAQEGPGSPGQETSYFGKQTLNSLIKFQEANANDILKPAGLTKGTGYFGAKTRAYISLSY